MALATSGDADGAAVWFQKALIIRPADVPARVRLADLQLEAGRFDDSAVLYRAVLAERPDTAAAHYGLARVLVERHDPAAVGHLERAVALAPAFGPAHYALALAYQRQGDRTRADASLARFRAARSGAVPLDDPLLERVVARRSGPYEDLARGRFLSLQGRPLEAIAALEHAVAANPRLVQAHVNLVAAYAAAKRFEQAEAAFRAAIALSPDLPEAHYNLGVLRLSQQRSEEAVSAFERAIAANPFYADAHNNLGYLLAQGPRRSEAADHFRAALAASPEHRDAHFNLARLLLADRQLDEAIAHFASAARHEDDKTALYLYALADACARRGQFDQAERHALAARSRAEHHGQQELVARIDEDLRRLKARRPPP